MAGKFTLASIVIEDGDYFAIRAPKGFEIYRNAGSHSVRCAVIGFDGADGLARVRKEIDRRKALEAAHGE